MKDKIILGSDDAVLISLSKLTTHAPSIRDKARKIIKIVRFIKAHKLNDENKQGIRLLPRIPHNPIDINAEMNIQRKPDFIGMPKDFHLYSFEKMVVYLKDSGLTCEDSLSYLMIHHKDKFKNEVE